MHNVSLRQKEEISETTSYHYKVDHSIRQILPEWILAFEGCLALLLTTTQFVHTTLGISPSQWNFLNSTQGGIVIGSYALVLLDSYPKIVHPIHPHTIEVRKHLEQLAAFYVRQLLKRIQEAQPGMEGVAMLSLAQTKTLYSQKEIVASINEKAFGIKTPTKSSFLTGEKYL